MRHFLIAVVVIFAVAAAFAQTRAVKTIARQYNDNDYTYVVAGYFNTQSNTAVNCNGNVNNVNCNASTNTTGFNTPARQVSYHVHGATFSLLLPDGRVAVVNCESKHAWLHGTAPSRRSCRMPLLDDIQADFDGDNAKLKWSVSIDGKKTESETYKILAVLPK